jgi:hypothetical protein
MSEPNVVRDGEAARVLGRLEARVAAIEDRLGRHEASITARMAAIEMKVDHVAHSLAQGLGALKLIHWIGGLSLMLAGFLARHVWETTR